mmetsp:Transcript_17017/g.46636  ORF Transcript_17017/g.46636 Transcript_17017/m.46636 type:complete len:202 (-) Transcript_17017:492-1097(-)
MTSQTSSSSTDAASLQTSSATRWWRRWRRAILLGSSGCSDLRGMGVRRWPRLRTRTAGQSLFVSKGVSHLPTPPPDDVDMPSSRDQASYHLRASGPFSTSASPPALCTSRTERRELRPTSRWPSTTRCCRSCSRAAQVRSAAIQRCLQNIICCSSLTVCAQTGESRWTSSATTCSPRLSAAGRRRWRSRSRPSSCHRRCKR